MPLPPALAARLAKRGILRSSAEPEIEEEVIAEDYDDQYKKMGISDKTDNDEDGQDEGEPEDDFTEPVIGCPNKWNVYHLCTAYCKEKWGNGKIQPSPTTERKRLKMLKKYPISEGWDEIYDPGTGRHYYWNKLTGEVSWLPLGHPRCKISLPANKLRALVRDTLVQEMEEDHEASESEEEELEENEEMETEPVELEEKSNRRNRDHVHDRSRGRPKLRENDLDPMDPAAYSEAPRGTWSTGLDRKGEAKTGADTTASGPLYQMRPYPSPGAVLRMNAEMKGKVPGKSDEEDEDNDD